MYRNLITILMMLCLSFIALGQEELTKEQKKAQRESAEAAAKLKKADDRIKACGSESVDFDAITDKAPRELPAAPSDKALIYVMSTNWLNYKTHAKLAVNGEWMGANRSKTYFYFELLPGAYYFCSEAANQDYFGMTVEAGKTYYLKQEAEPSLFKPRTSLVILPESKAMEELPRLNLSIFKIKSK